MNEFTTVLQLQKSTKNKHVYGAAESPIPSVYIEKSALSDPPPKELTITVTGK